MITIFPVFSLISAVFAETGPRGSVFGDQTVNKLQDGLVPQSYNSVMQGMKDRSEEGTLKRYKLQKQLIEKEPPLAEALDTAFQQLVEAHDKLIDMQGAVTNQTIVIDADSSAGGLTATSRALMSEVPDTQKLMNKVMTQLFQALQRDSRVINESLSETEDDYRARMKSSSQTIAAMLAKQDRVFAAMAYSQEQAMRSAADKLQSQYSSELTTQQTEAQKALSKIKQVSDAIGKQSSRVSAALSDAEEMPKKITALHKAKLADAQTQFEQTLTDYQKKAEAGISDSADFSMTAVQNMGMKLSKSFQAELDGVQADLQAKLSGVGKLVSTQSKAISKSVQTSAIKTTNALRQVESASKKEIQNIDKKSTVATSDSVKVAQDSKAVLDQLGSMLDVARQRFTTGLGTAQAAVPAKLQGTLQGLLSGEKGMNADVTQSLLRVNNGVGYIAQFTDSQVSRLGANLDTKLSVSRGQIANRGVDVKGRIDKLSGQVDRNGRDVSANTAVAVGSRRQSLQGIVTTMGGSIDDLASLLGDSSKEAKDKVAAMRNELLGLNSDTLQGVLGKVKELTDGSNDQLQEFLRSVVGPDSELTDEQFSQMAALLSTLLGVQERLGSEQDGLMSQAKSGHLARTKKLGTIAERIKAASVDNIGRAKQIGANADGKLALLKSQLAHTSMTEAERARKASMDGMSTIDALFGNVDSNFRRIHQSVAESVAGVGSNLDAASKQLNRLTVVSAQSLGDLTANALTIISQSEKGQGQDLTDAKNSIASLKSRFVDSFKRNAVATTDKALADVFAKLDAADKEGGVVKTYVGSLQDSLKRVKTDLSVASNYNADKAAEFRGKIADANRQLAVVRSDVETQLTATISDFQKQLTDKETFLNSTNVDLNSQLTKVQDLVKEAQARLRANLYLYQSRIDDIVNQIRSYMNLSSNADELAIAHGISTQLAGVNTTEVQLASLRAGVEGKLDDMRTKRASELDGHRAIVGDLIDGVVGVEATAEQSRLNGMAGLTAVGLQVDSSTQALRTALANAKAKMQSAIDRGQTAAQEAIKKNEAAQSATLAGLQSKSADVEAQSRKRFLENAYKMDSLNDDLYLATKQLSQLLTNANGTIDDISTTAMNHMNLGVETLARLNENANRKVASIADVMNAFSSVVVTFVNETDYSMRRVMGQLDAIDSVSGTKLAEIKQRAQHEVDWVGSNLNSTVDKFRLNVAQERAVQEGLKKALLESASKLKTIKAKEAADVAEVADEINRLKEGIATRGQAEITKVRHWIANRSPQITNRLLGKASLLQVGDSGREKTIAIANDIRRRLAVVMGELKQLNQRDD